MENDSTDKELIKLLVNGDVKSFDILFSIYAKRLFGFAYRFLHSKHEAEELVQDVFIKVWEKREDIKPELSFKSYLFTIAYRDILNRMRKEDYRQAYLREVVSFSTETNDLEEGIEYGSILEQVNMLLEKLTERKRQIFIKSRLEGISSKEIAKEFNMAVGTVDNNISIVLKFLRSNLQKEMFAFLLFLAITSI